MKILEHTKGSSVTKDNLHKILANLDNPDGTLITSRHHVLFVWQFSAVKPKILVLKPYKLRFEDIILHLLSITKFKELFQGHPVATDAGPVLLRPMEVYAVGNIDLKTNRFPFIIQEFSQGIMIQDAKIGNQKLQSLHLSTLFREIAKKGFHIDPFPTNWRVVRPANSDVEYYFEYIDLLFTQNFATMQRIEAFIENLGKPNIPI